MGTYHRAVSKRVKTVNGMNIAGTKFFGKAPSVFAPDSAQSKWDSFLNRAEKTAVFQKDRVQYVMMVGLEDLAGKKEVPVARWNGQVDLHDGFWDKNIVGELVRGKNGRWTFRWNQTKDQITE